MNIAALQAAIREHDELRTQLDEAIELLRESRFGAARRPTWEADTRSFLSRLEAPKVSR